MKQKPSAVYASESVIDTLAHVVAVLKEARRGALLNLPELIDGAINDGEALVEILRAQANER